MSPIVVATNVSPDPRSLKSVRSLFGNSEEKQNSVFEAKGNDTFESLVTEEQPDDQIIKEMIQLLPAVMKNLSTDGNDIQMLQFFQLVAENKFPLTNISYMLWNEVVKWFSYKTTTQMRYSSQTKTFWKLGWRMFGARFVNYMDGYKSHGDTVLKMAEPGNFSPDSSEINFAVPSLSQLRYFNIRSICSYSNHLSSRAVGHSMQRSLKLKLQNALNQAFVETGSPAIFVGGRRHNRKKRKNKNGQNKKKNKKTGVVSGPVLPKTPDFALYEAELARYAEPKVSCLDIKEPEFAEHPVKCRLKDEDRDSMYNSSDSLSSYSSDQNGTQQTTETNVTEEEHESTVPQKTGLPRLHSEDSGVFDDDDDNEDYDEDVGFCDDITVEYDVVNNDERSIQDELSEVAVGDNEVETEDCSLVIVNDVEPADDNQDVTVTHEHITETNDETEIVDELEKVSVETETVLGNDQKDSSIDDENEAALLNINEEENNGSNPNKFLEETDPFLKFANYPDDEEEIVFDLSQLEVNNIDEISKTKDTIQQSIEDQEVPTVLEEEIPLTVPLDLLIDNDDNDDVLYEAKNRKELSITCNPLYEYTVMEEEDKLSIKSYQSGFKTDFDNINLIQIPVPASDKAAHKSLKESTPLMKRQPIWGDRDDELACCVIL